ncbi:HEAT repeat protein [Aquisphaera giovannonii]|uniref:HEAT repeat protein n=1 Tax=Aquisphaera giovannonii TaxID=406548 RepID=A0A5B9VZ60_9BACT|nr:hypothetical protein [Aquisphaera giovannonii]QEH33568.1 HEAT repeat protein [Aquisphaera giovannonii]
MPERRRAGLIVGGIAGGALVAATAYFGLFNGRREAPSAPAAANPSWSEGSPLGTLAEGLRNSDPAALGIVANRSASQKNEAKKALTDQEAAEWVEVLGGLRAGIEKFTPPARATAALVAGNVMEKFAVEPAPACWSMALPPVHDVLAACLTDGESNVRYIALGEVGKLWVWLPGRTMAESEENLLGLWKEGLHAPVLRCLAGTDVRTRIGAVACLGLLPMDAAAAPAIPYLEDRESVDVRRQALVSFANRPTLLTEDLLLKRLHDDDETIRDSALVMLKARGLTQEQIHLGSLMVSPLPQQRASVINLIKERGDIDPLVWLLQLSHDADESVRVQSVAALADLKPSTVPIKRRLAEMARRDQSRSVREAASKFVPDLEETTASLPPLPGSPSLNPKAN